MPEGRTRWTDDRLDDKFASLERKINSLPDRVTIMEGKLGSVAEDVKESRDELRQMHREFSASRQGMSRGEKIALFAASTAFLGAFVSAVAVLSGGAG